MPSWGKVCGFFVIITLLLCVHIIQQNQNRIQIPSSSFALAIDFDSGSTRGGAGTKTVEQQEEQEEQEEPNFENALKMAWSCSGATNQALVENLAKAGLIRSSLAKKAMLETDRKAYVPLRNHEEAYEDHPVEIGYKATISAPHMHAMVLDNFSDIIEKNERPRILDVGCGSGYLLGTFSRMLTDKQQTYKKEDLPAVVGLEIIPELVSMSRNSLNADNPDLQSSGFVDVRTGNGWDVSGLGQFDVIHVGAAASEIPTSLSEALRPGGRMLIPVGTIMQNLEQVDKDANGKLNTKTITGVRYVPLVKG